jgi:two-component system, OmpR family, sensor histidine kinase KdpD
MTTGEAEAPGRRRGKLKVFLGYAAGVGKTFRMLDEARQLAGTGHDVVIGYFEPHGRQETIARAAGLELVPRRHLEYRGRPFEEMDTDAVLARRPEICVVDEFAHTNVPGSPRAKRWEDVAALLDAGIDVITTMNVQHVESLNDRVEEISGVRVRETIPDWVVKEADDLLLIDVPPRALLNRLQRGVIYPRERVPHAMEGFFKEPTLAALRELALRLAAHEVDLHYADDPWAKSSPLGRIGGSSSPAKRSTEPRERILIHVTSSPASTALIRRGCRVADYLKGDCIAVAVASGAKGAAQDREAVAQHLAFARRLHIETQILEAADAAVALVDFARRHSITQIILPKPPPQLVPLLLKRHTTMRVVALAHDKQVTVVAARKKLVTDTRRP